MTQNYLESSFLSHLRIDDFGEISDLFYHVLVLMYQQGIQVEDIER